MVAALDPGADYLPVAIVPAAMDGGMVGALARNERGLHFVELAAELYVIGGEARGVFGVDLREVEFVPTEVDDYFCAG